MVNNLACEDCRFLVKCSAYAKLKPFLEDARRDLGVTLTFDARNDYKSIDDDDDNDSENED